MGRYDEIQLNHYNSVALKSGSSASSTMADKVIRETESESIIKAITTWMRKQDISESELNILDVGCGNGTTICCLKDHFPAANITGIEYNEELHKIANSRTELQVLQGDLRNPDTLPKTKFNVLISQRVIINIMDSEDQDISLKNLISLMDTNGLYIAIEAFTSGFNLINEARNELGLESVKMPHHNLYLGDGFFEVEGLNKLSFGVEEYFLSTHYYLSYVLYPAIAKANGAEFKRDNFMTPFMINLLPNKGAFGANRFLTFQKV